MHKDTLPLKIDPFRFAENAAKIQGILYIEDMPRLAASLPAQNTPVEVSIDFGIDEQDVRFLQGSFKTKLILQCQRCMELFDQELGNDFMFGIVHTEQEAETLAKTYDPILAEDNILFLNPMVEEELIINLPIVARHPEKECKVQLPLAAQTESAMEKDNPFKVIELLRSKQRDK